MDDDALCQPGLPSSDRMRRQYRGTSSVAYYSGYVSQGRGALQQIRQDFTAFRGAVCLAVYHWRDKYQRHRFAITFATSFHNSDCAKRNTPCTAGSQDEFVILDSPSI
eukprot:scaffold211236_cov34-Prasinocladus_malaysianus.AAC.1